MGGMQRVATALHQALEEHPEVTLYTEVLRTSWAMTHVRFLPFALRLRRHIPRLVAQHHIDVVLFSSMVTASLAVWLRKALPRETVTLATIVHGQDVTLPVGIYQRFVPRVFEALDGVLPVSRATGQACIERGCRPGKVQVIPNGIYPDRFTGSPLQTGHALLTEAFPEAAALPPEAMVLCSVGRQVKRKGFHWFVEAVMPRLSEQVHYWLAGEGPMRSEIEAAIRRHGLQHRVQLLGRVSEAQLEALYRGTELFVMPNIEVPGDMEGFGVVMLEAGLCQTPALAAGIEGILDVIKEGENGHLVSSKDVDAYVEKIETYAADRDALKRLGVRAEAYVLNTFTWPAIAAQFVRVLRDLQRA